MPDAQANQALDLAALIGYIDGRYRFTPEEYPALAHLPPEMRLAFVASHINAHIGKSTGRIATATEAADHSGEAINPESLHEPVLKIILNALKLASEIGLNADQIIGGIPALMKSR